LVQSDWFFYIPLNFQIGRQIRQRGLTTYVLLFGHCLSESLGQRANCFAPFVLCEGTLYDPPKKTHEVKKPENGVIKWALYFHDLGSFEGSASARHADHPKIVSNYLDVSETYKQRFGPGC